MKLLFFHEYRYMYNPSTLLTRRSKGFALTLYHRPSYSCLVQTLVLGLLGHRVARVVLVLVGLHHGSRGGVDAVGDDQACRSVRSEISFQRIPSFPVSFLLALSPSMGFWFLGIWGRTGSVERPHRLHDRGRELLAQQGALSHSCDGWLHLFRVSRYRPLNGEDGWYRR